MGRRKEKEAHLAMAGGEDPADLRELLHSLRHGGAVEVTVLGQGLGGQFHPGEGVMLGARVEAPPLGHHGLGGRAGGGAGGGAGGVAGVRHGC